MGDLKDYVQRKGMLHARLDLAIGFARLASYFQQTGNLHEYREQLAFAETQYQQIVKDWKELQAEIEAEADLFEKRRTAEDCLDKLKRGEQC